MKVESCYEFRTRARNFNHFRRIIPRGLGSRPRPVESRIARTACLQAEFALLQKQNKLEL